MASTKTSSKFKIAVASVLLATFGFAGPVVAASIGYTEGTRQTVVGTTKITAPDTSSDPFAAFDLLDGGATVLGNALDAGEQIEIFGRIVGAIDNFLFIEAASSFEISFIFGGYEVYDTGTSGSISAASVSGLTGEPAGGGSTGKDVVFKLLDNANGNVELASDTFTSEKTSGDPLIFAGGAGSYVLQIDGTSDNQVALYDVRISAVPIPAGGLLLLTALGSVAALRRKRKAA